MSTIREQIVAAAVTALNTGRPSGVPEFVRTRVDSPSADQLPADTVYQAEETVETLHNYKEGRGSRGPVVKRFLLLKVEVVTKSGVGTEPDKAADPALAWASKALAAAGSLGNLAIRAPDELGTKFEYEQGETSFCRATQMFRYQYQSRADDAEQVT
jgi:hypothetical protein